jgi:hypothetical protein
MQEQAIGFFHHHGVYHHTGTFNLISYPSNYNQMYLNQDDTQPEAFDEMLLYAALCCSLSRRPSSPPWHSRGFTNYNVRLRRLPPSS